MSHPGPSKLSFQFPSKDSATLIPFDQREKKIEKLIKIVMVPIQHKKHLISLRGSVHIYKDQTFGVFIDYFTISHKCSVEILH